MNTEVDTIEQTEEVHQAVVSTASDKPIQFSVTDAAIAEMRTNFLPLTIKGPDDKEGYKRVYEARMVVKGSRVAVDKTRKELNEDALKWQRTVNGEAKRITEQLEEIETHLELEEKAYNDERQRIADEKARQARIRYQTRTDELRALGFTYDANLDTFGFGEYLINVDDIRDLSDEEYEPSLYGAQMAYRLEQDRLAELAAAKKAEDERIAAEQKAEAERLAEGRRLLEQQQAELKRQQDQIEADRRKLQDEKDATLLNSRISRLLKAGFWENGTAYERPNVRIRVGMILSFDDAQFDDIISEAIEYFRQAEQKRIDEEAAEAARIKAQQEAEKARIKADKERQKRLAPDKKEIKKYLLSLVQLPRPKAITQPESIAFYEQMLERWNGFTENEVKLLEAL